MDHWNFQNLGIKPEKCYTLNATRYSPAALIIRSTSGSIGASQFTKPGHLNLQDVNY